MTSSLSKALVLFGIVVSVACSTRSEFIRDDEDRTRDCDAQLRRIRDSWLRAQRCAEWFVAVQGYTVASTTEGSVPFVPESIEFARSEADALRQRRGTLAPKAVAICRFPDDERGFNVIFAYVRSDSVHGRGVTITPDGRGLRMQHSDAFIDWTTRFPQHCRAAT
jgi:hypothetical protein